MFPIIELEETDLSFTYNELVEEAKKGSVIYHSHSKVGSAKAILRAFKRLVVGVSPLAYTHAFTVSYRKIGPFTLYGFTLVLE